MKRNSSIELLRIVAMLMIILGHLAGHGILHMISDDALQIEHSRKVVAEK